MSKVLTLAIMQTRGAITIKERMRPGISRVARIRYHDILPRDIVNTLGTRSCGHKVTRETTCDIDKIGARFGVLVAHSPPDELANSISSVIANSDNNDFSKVCGKTHLGIFVPCKKKRNRLYMISPSLV